MAVSYYLSPKGDRATQQAIKAYTHDDVLKPAPGFKVITGHFHLDLNEMSRERGTIDFQSGWVPVFRGLGVNVVTSATSTTTPTSAIPAPSASWSRRSL
jgi:hypothetical protein